MTDTQDRTAANDEVTALEKLASLPMPPTFSSIDDEREHRKRRLALAFRVFSSLGFEEGVAGHITVRDPEHTDRFWVNPWIVPFAHIKVSDLLLVDHDGTILHGDRPLNGAAFAIHSRIHAARPDVIAAAHSHSTHGRAFSATGRMLRPLNQDACAFYNDHGLFSDYTGVVFDTSEGERIAQALAQNKAAILRNHGLLSVGHNVDEAVYWFASMERACQVQLLAEAAHGDLVEVDPHHAQATADLVGSHYSGWLNAQPLFEKVEARNPDVYD
jgi:ribulose-5-phosphate 4-epimerase/fuculose-1-phosphate aldolase